MKYDLNPGKNRRSINFLDNICYSRVRDLDGNALDLHLSVMVQNGNSEMRLAAGLDDEADRTFKPLIIWIPGGGFRGCDKNLMVSEMQFLAEAGYVVASIYYRSSAQGHYPDQIIDVKTAIRFLRTHAGDYQIDPERVAVIGRSAGGHLSAMAAMNLEDNISEEWKGVSSKVQACCNLFGPVNLVKLLDSDVEEMKNNPDYRWKSIGETHGGALVGENGPEAWPKLRDASPIHYVNDAMCPMLILHGDQDPLVPYEQSEELYELIAQKGMEDRVDLIRIINGGHGTREFFQNQTKERILDFFDKILKS